VSSPPPKKRPWMKTRGTVDAPVSWPRKACENQCGRAGEGEEGGDGGREAVVEASAACCFIDHVFHRCLHRDQPAPLIEQTREASHAALARGGSTHLDFRAV
jgi:hypothetical protein